MELMDLLRQGEGGRELDQLAGNFGLSRDQTEAVVANLVPEISRRLERNSLSRGGVADLIAMLGAAQTQPTRFDGAEGLQRGNALLEQVFGTRDVSRAVAARASLSSGIGESIIKAMLPYIIQMVMSAFARRTSGGLGDILSKIPNLGGGGHAPSGQGGGFNIPLPLPGGGSSSTPGGFPLPGGGGGGGMLPGPEGMSGPSRNPYSDLSDVIRRGGRSVSVGGNPLWRMVRGIIGSALGFQSRGIVSWIVRMVIMRYGWSILRNVLRRAVVGR